MDVLYIAKNRIEFTKASFTALARNTDWDLVNTLYVYDDGSTDGTREWLRSTDIPAVKTEVIDSRLGAPAAIMKDYLCRSRSTIFAKIDNDVVVPPGWLNACVTVMNTCPVLDLLGIEHPYSRTPHYPGGPVPPRPELTAAPGTPYSPCDSIGGIGLMRRRVFTNRTLLAHSVYGGFTEFQVWNPDIVKGWITPPLNVILLDRLPVEPWMTLSRGYIARGWQRAWSGYDPVHPFWSWWKPEAE